MGHTFIMLVWVFLQAHKDWQMDSPTGPEAAEAAAPVLFPSLGQEIIQSPGTEKADAKNIPKDFLSSLCFVLGGDKGASTVPSLQLHSKMQLAAPRDSTAQLPPRDRDERKRDSHSQIFNHLL